MMSRTYLTGGGVQVTVADELVESANEIARVITALDSKKGVVLRSRYEYPGRYTRFDWAFSDPPIQIETRSLGFKVISLNARGRVMLPWIRDWLDEECELAILSETASYIEGQVINGEQVVDERRRSLQRTIFTFVRSFTKLFQSSEDSKLGLYGAFSYDLGFQFEPIILKKKRPPDHRDIVLYLPDSIVSIDHATGLATRTQYEFAKNSNSTTGLKRETEADPISVLPAKISAGSDHVPAEYEEAVEAARRAFKKGDLFEAVLSQTFSQPLNDCPSKIFERLSDANPSPYGALMNLGNGEGLIAASPEMFVRVEGRRVETCPISGTIERGKDATEDAANIRTLLNSEKDESELTMCTDVDRNDKSRICEPGSVKVIGRRQIELYSRLIHTVDHVEGILAKDFDALDAFLTHMWAVTVTGAPKSWAMQFIEDTEKSVRRWYGGAIGRLTFDGDLNTGLTLRTVRVSQGTAEVRVGATLLYDSVPADENLECNLKASALFSALEHESSASAKPAELSAFTHLQVLIVDHHDSFVHTIADYLRQIGCLVNIQRPENARRTIAQGDRIDLVCLSPGPGLPNDFKISETLELCKTAMLPVLGICLGLQGIAEFEGAKLATLDYPMHGKPSYVESRKGWLSDILPPRFKVGRYHSTHVLPDSMPEALAIEAMSDDGVVMAISHTRLPWAAVQFHPESIMTSKEVVGLPLLGGLVSYLTKHPQAFGGKAPIGTPSGSSKS